MKIYCCRSRKVDLYSQEQQYIREFNHERIADARIILNIALIFNIFIQATAILNPIEGTLQYEVNQVYFVLSAIKIGLIVISYTVDINYVIPCLILYLLRQIICLYDPEKRKDKMGAENWFMLCQIQSLAIGIFMILLNNSMSKGFVVLYFIAVVFYLGLIDASYGLKLESLNSSFGFSMLFPFFFISVVLPYLRESNKEFYKEMKNKVAQTNEFKTIFDELDESVVIFDENNQIVQFNKMYQKLTLDCFGANVTNKFVKYVSFYEQIQKAKANRENEAKKSKIQRFIKKMRFCKSPQNENEKIINLEEEQEYMKAINELFYRQIFQKYRMKQQSNSNNKKSSAQFVNHSGPFCLNDDKNQDAEKNYDLEQLLRMDNEQLSSICFEIIKPENEFLQSQERVFVRLKKKNYDKSDQKRTMLQIIDVSSEIMYKQVYEENEFLAITNATVSHELRNPLFAISSQHMKINLCLQELMNILSKNKGRQLQEVEKPLQEVAKMIDHSIKIQDSSVNMMAFLVDDLLDFSQINAGMFRKSVSKFDLKESLQEIVRFQEEKAKMQGIDLKIGYFPQVIGDQKPISLFQSYKQGKDDQQSDDENTSGTFQVEQSLFDKNYEPLLIWTDKRRMQQVLLNIQSNALKFTDEGGSVTVLYSLYKEQGKSYAEIQVIDSGCGIKRNDRKKLFKLFGFLKSTEDLNTRGIGLGLVISKKITDLFDGQIGFKSKWGKGSTFAFRFQLHKEIELLDPVIESSQSSVTVEEFGNRLDKIELSSYDIPQYFLPNQSLPKTVTMSSVETAIVDRILIVDDEPFNLEACKIALQCAIPGVSLGDRIDTACNGFDAIDKVKRRYTKNQSYILILMDCNMPKLDGYQATIAIRKFIEIEGRPQPTIIALTGHCESKYLQKALDFKMDQVLGKPVKMFELKNALADLHPVAANMTVH